MVFYRKYRPQKISELDSAAVRETLYSIFSKHFDTAHAYLFSGPKGLGKTSAARIVAKVINCEKHSGKQNSKLTEADIEPDNKCSQCVSITNGTNFDVLEIDGASNRGIDEIRDLREKINLLPSSARRKVYIIDEVHMLTTEAFNALLKTLEEPPPHAVFILCTTELHKVPQTIVSRCFRVDFKKATDDEIKRSIKRIIKAEGIKIDEEVLLEIARMSDGSFRDAAKILEELTLTAGKKVVTKGMLEGRFNTLGIETSIEQFITALKTKDTKKGFGVVSKLSEQGMDFKYFLENLLERLHMMLLAKMGASDASVKVDFEVLEIKKLLEILAKAYMETKYAVLPQLPLELALVEWSENVSDDTLRGPAPTFPPVSAHSEFSSKSSLRAVGTPSNRVIPSDQDDFYQSFINGVKEHNHLIAGVLRSCEIEDIKGNMLQIVALSKFHKEKLEEEKSLLILEEIAQKLKGEKVKINITLRG